jgi:hypothetical protein
MPSPFVRCQILPLPDHRVSFQLDGVERLCWQYGTSYPRPFFYPLVGPSGVSLTRMGHPGAPDHDHHRSVWFAHHKVVGVDFWSDRTKAQIRQQQWLAYHDGDDDCKMAVQLGWYDGHDPKPMLQQELVVVLRPAQDCELFLELQSVFRPTAESLEFGQTNFGFLAVRVAKHLSAHFGGGIISNDSGGVGEPAIFGKPSQYIDYSGQVPKGGFEGVTYVDHPSNPGFPARWHVREDGWMGASVCMAASVVTTRREPLRLRYLLHAHRGKSDDARASKVAADFAATPPLEVVKSTARHEHFTIRRVSKPT